MTKKAKNEGYKYKWADLRRRFIEIGEWITFEEMARALKEAERAGGAKAPAVSLIRKKAAPEKWIEKRQDMERASAALAREAIIDRQKKELIEIYDKQKQLGGGLLAMGGNYIKQLEEKAAKLRAAGNLDAAGAITSTFEALAFIRVGAALEKAAAETLNGGRPGSMKNADPDAEPIDDGVPLGIVILPEQLTDDEWQARRRKNLAPAKPKD